VLFRNVVMSIDNPQNEAVTVPYGHDGWHPGAGGNAVTLPVACHSALAVATHNSVLAGTFSVQKLILKETLNVVAS